MKILILNIKPEYSTYTTTRGQGYKLEQYRVDYDLKMPNGVSAQGQIVLPPADYIDLAQVKETIKQTFVEQLTLEQ